MKKNLQMPLAKTAFFAFVLLVSGCNTNEPSTANSESIPTVTEAPAYFSLRPETEKAYGYTHAVESETI